MKRVKRSKRAKQAELPRGWTSKRAKTVAAHYERQSESDAVAEDEAAFKGRPETVMEIPTELLPRVRRLLAKHKAARAC